MIDTKPGSVPGSSCILSCPGLLQVAHDGRELKLPVANISIFGPKPTDLGGVKNEDLPYLQVRPGVSLAYRAYHKRKEVCLHVCVHIWSTNHASRSG